MRSWTYGLGLALSSVLAAAGPGAVAADYYGPGYKDGAFAQIASWTGFYAGVNGGYAFDAWSAHGGIFDNGGFGGGQIGYNLQGPLGLSRMFVLGVEADLQGTDIYHAGKGNVTYAGGAVDPDWHKRSVGEFGSARGRFGISAERTLLYFTGGFAYGSERNSFDDLVTKNIYKAAGIQPGYTFGGGVEYKIAPCWSLKAEYQYVDLSSDRPAGNLGGHIMTGDTEISTVRGGINYHF